MKTVLVIGIGAGDPDHLTVQAIKALNRADVFFILDKGAEKAELVELRREICRRHIRPDRPHRFVEAESPPWDRQTPAYRSTVDTLNQDKRRLFERLIGEDLAEGECGAFLVWGDPALYDSTVRILEAMASDGFELDYEVIPGISAVQVLAARHRIPLNRIGGSVQITTGRRLAEGFPDEADSVVVMLDAHDTYARFADQDLEIYWGAYLGLPDEMLVSGKLADVADDIQRLRAAARERKGWIMDSYLLRRR
jgi:precorrin-6A synthase